MLNILSLFLTVYRISLATPQSLDQRSEMEELAQKMARRRDTDAGQSKRKWVRLDPADDVRKLGFDSLVEMYHTTVKVGNHSFPAELLAFKG